VYDWAHRRPTRYQRLMLRRIMQAIAKRQSLAQWCDEARAEGFEVEPGPVPGTAVALYAGVLHGAYHGPLKHWRDTADEARAELLSR
jgi:hypothetical protein